MSALPLSRTADEVLRLDDNCLLHPSISLSCLAISPFSAFSARGSSSVRKRRERTQRQGTKARRRQAAARPKTPASFALLARGSLFLFSPAVRGAGAPERFSMPIACFSAPVSLFPRAGGGPREKASRPARWPEGMESRKAPARPQSGRAPITPRSISPDATQQHQRKAAKRTSSRHALEHPLRHPPTAPPQGRKADELP